MSCRPYPSLDDWWTGWEAIYEIRHERHQRKHMSSEGRVVPKLTMLAVLVTMLTVAVARIAYAADITGTNKPDRIIGTQQGDFVYAMGGRDHVEDRGSGDQLHGGAGNDTIYGNQGEDTIYGDNGKDRLFGNDLPDGIHANDGYSDRLNCGDGKDDWAIVDGYDIVKNCEYVSRR
jgi:hypothetical protein